MGSSGSSAPTAQQTELETQQANQQATLDQQENDRRKRLLQATQGTRVFRGSALSTAAGTNTASNAAASGPSSSQQSPINVGGTSILGGGAAGGARTVAKA